MMCTHNGILAIKNAIPPRATAWKNVESVTHSEISQRKTDADYQVYAEAKKWD